MVFDANLAKIEISILDYHLEFSFSAEEFLDQNQDYRLLIKDDRMLYSSTSLLCKL